MSRYLQATMVLRTWFDVGFSLFETQKGDFPVKDDLLLSCDVKFKMYHQIQSLLGGTWTCFHTMNTKRVNTPHSTLHHITYIPPNPRVLFNNRYISIPKVWNGEHKVPDREQFNVLYFMGREFKMCRTLRREETNYAPIP